ncbi:MAG: peptidoglycan-binding protein [bacterium]|nr:peptidoglycan-binding protein [bacterium]MCP4965790.1 peptidoglycan-binding protein [bacterium]
MSRRILLVVTLIAVVVAAAVGWVAGTRIKSPEQVAAEAEPPEPSLISVPVVSMVIANDVVTRGTVRFDEPEAVFTPTLAVPELSPVVTWVPSVGEELEEGSVLFELAGRPTFALRGELPLFRTVTPGDKGEDIAQLQTALTRLGFDPGIVDGVYGPDTEGAVRAFYQSNGYQPIGTDPALLDQVEAAEATVDGARDIYNEANTQRAAAEKAQRAVTAAAADLAKAEDELELAQTRLAEAEAGTHPDTGSAPTEAEMTQLQSAVIAGEDWVSGSEAMLQTALGAADAAGPPRDISGERRALDAALADLAEARSLVGSPVPDGEFLFFKVFPIRIDAVLSQRGDLASGELMQVSGSRLAIDSSVGIEEADFIEEGDTVLIELTRLGIELNGTVSVKAGRPGTNGVDIDEVYLEILPDEVRADLNNTNVKLTIPVATRATEGDVLAVPAAALSATGSGDTIVTVEMADGTIRVVTVLPGLSAPGGMVEVTAIDGDLAEGDRVVIGLQQGTRSESAADESEEE